MAAGTPPADPAGVGRAGAAGVGGVGGASSSERPGRQMTFCCALSSCPGMLRWMRA